MPTPSNAYAPTIPATPHRTPHTASPADAFGKPAQHRLPPA
ncbi:MAG: hypothetical protein R2856_18520 [Caldilineaceae bacterium]